MQQQLSKLQNDYLDGAILPSKGASDTLAFSPRHVG